MSCSNISKSTKVQKTGNRYLEIKSGLVTCITEPVHSCDVKSASAQLRDEFSARSECLDCDNLSPDVGSLSLCDRKSSLLNSGMCQVLLSSDNDAIKEFLTLINTIAVCEGESDLGPITNFRNSLNFRHSKRHFEPCD